MTTVKVRFVPGIKPIIKHADHDQSSHGSWAGNNQNLSDNYQTFHRPSLGGDFGASLDDVTNGIYPDDVYSPRGVQIYGTGYKELDKKAHALIMEYKGKPDKEIRIYRAVPKKIDTRINTGDWVTPIQEYAVQHGQSNLNDDYQILFRDVKAKEIFTSGDSWLEWGYAPEVVAKHAMHDQSSHGNWAGSKTGAGNNLSLAEAAKLINQSDPLKEKVYAAEGKLNNRKIDASTKPQAPLPQNYPLDKRAEYDKAYKEYSKKFTAWAVEQEANLISDTGKKVLDGSPKGVKKYVEETIKADWFVERFGDGSSLPPLEVKTANTNAAGRHILRLTRNRATGEIVKQENIISIDRYSTKNESTILHEISHFATAISQTTPYSGHGVEFAKNHIYIVDKAAGSERATRLRESYIAEGVQIDN